MNRNISISRMTLLSRSLMTSVLALAASGALADPDTKTNAASAAVTVRAGRAAAEASASPGRKPRTIVVKTIESDGEGAQKERKETAWLGVGIEEVSDAMASQLGLDSGVGLLVTYVVADSPAAKAGIQKNDVLVTFEEQSLVHPSQLRKLVQVRKEGDRVKLTYFRGGKKESATATLAKREADLSMSDGELNLPGNVFLFEPGAKGFGDSGAWRLEMKHLQDSLKNLHVDREGLQQEIQRSMEDARKAMKDALRHSSNHIAVYGPGGRVLRDLARKHVEIAKGATVTVNSSSDEVKTAVKKDDSGTYVIVASPKKHLTAHDKDGKLVFDGEIETPEQLAKVPKKILAKVEPMLSKVATTKAAEKSETEPEDDSK